MDNRKLTKLVLALGAVIALLPQSQAAPLGTSFNYQGRLADGSAPANGYYDLRFTLFDAASAGSAVGTPSVVTTNATPVSNGVFTVYLDFGAAFAGQARWLSIEVKTNLAATFNLLSPRTELKPTPNALYAPRAGVADSVAPSSVTAAGLAAGSVTGTTIANGTIGTADLSSAVLNSTFWRLGGNNGITAGTDFLGTIDNKPLEIRVNNQRALRIDPAGDSAADADLLADGTVNFIAGSSFNSIAAGVVGATIGGGGATNYAGAVMANTAAGDYSTISGGMANSIAGEASGASIVGGSDNRIGARSTLTTIAGGGGNRISSDSTMSAIGGGLVNSIGSHSRSSVISGGEANTISNGVPEFDSANYNTIGGGKLNTIGILTVGGSIGGGIDNRAAQAFGATVAGGSRNTASNDFATVAGGSANVAGGAAIGTLSAIFDPAVGATVSGGVNNRARRANTAVSGGEANTVTTKFSAIGGGLGNTIYGIETPQVGTNCCEGAYAVIGGGRSNTIVGFYNFHSVVSGGENNTVISPGNGGILGNVASTIGGGSQNRIVAQYATIPGGQQNEANRNYTFAAGRRAKANHPGAFVWADSTDADFASARTNQVRIRAAGGLEVVGSNQAEAIKFSASRPGDFATPVGLALNGNTSGNSAPAMRVVNSGGNSVDGALSVSAAGTGFIAKFGNSSAFVSSLATDGTWSALAFNSTSDRAAKENFTEVNPNEVLEKVAALPMSRWTYKTAPGVEHIGPVAQDFHAAFGLNGKDDKHIATVDADGVALAAIQGLNEKVESRTNDEATARKNLEEKLLQNASEITELKESIIVLQELVKDLSKKLSNQPR